MAFTKFGGMILPVAFLNNIPTGWLVCDGRAVPRATYPDLFAFLGTTFGSGDGVTTFNLPNLSAAAPIGVGTGSYSSPSTYTLGQTVGESAHALSTAEMPAHQHVLNARSSAGSTTDPTSNRLGDTAGPGNIYRVSASDGSNLDSSAVGPSGQGLAHENRQPFASVQFLIAYIDVDPDYFEGEVRIWPSASIPTPKWKLCDGSSFTTAGEAALFSTIGYVFGGSGANFNVPNLQGLLIVHLGAGPGLGTYSLADTGGAEKVALSTSTMPAHSHAFVSGAGRTTRTNNATPAGELLAKTTVGVGNVYDTPTAGTGVTLHADSIRSTGSGTAHENRMPSVAINFIIAAQQ